MYYQYFFPSLLEIVSMQVWIKYIYYLEGMFEIQENQGEVSILFCDICGFDDVIAVEKENIVNLLDNLFRGFDALCVSNGM